jgi:hypothetical protein
MSAKEALTTLLFRTSLTAFAIAANLRAQAADVAKETATLLKQRAKAAIRNELSKVIDAIDKE